MPSADDAIEHIRKATLTYTSVLVVVALAMAGIQRSVYDQECWKDLFLWIGLRDLAASMSNAPASANSPSFLASEHCTSFPNYERNGQDSHCRYLAFQSGKAQKSIVLMLVGTPLSSEGIRLALEENIPLPNSADAGGSVRNAKARTGTFDIQTADDGVNWDLPFHNYVLRQTDNAKEAYTIEARKDAELSAYENNLLSSHNISTNPDDLRSGGSDRRKFEFALAASFVDQATVKFFGFEMPAETFLITFYAVLFTIIFSMVSSLKRINQLNLRHHSSNSTWIFAMRRSPGLEGTIMEYALRFAALVIVISPWFALLATLYVTNGAHWLLPVDFFLALAGSGILASVHKEFIEMRMPNTMHESTSGSLRPL
jgi:hypothetical protein